MLFRSPGSGGGAKMVHADPRFTRTSAMADIYARIRTGTDVAYFGGLINYVLQNNLFHDEYVKNYTNASFLIKKEFGFHDGLFTGYDPQTRKYDTTSWAYEGDTTAQADYDRTQQEALARGEGPPTGAPMIVREATASTRAPVVASSCAAAITLVLNAPSIGSMVPSRKR